MIDQAFWVQVLAPAFAAYISTRVGLAVATERANRALNEANRAHQRIDRLMQ